MRWLNSWRETPGEWWAERKSQSTCGTTRSIRFQILSRCTSIACGGRSTPCPRSRCCILVAAPDTCLGSRQTQGLRWFFRRTNTRAVERMVRVPNAIFLPRKTMLDSVRARLTLWYTGVLALFLVVLSLTTYFIFWRSTVKRTDNNLAELADAFLNYATRGAGRYDRPQEVRDAAREAIGGIAFGATYSRC